MVAKHIKESQAEYPNAWSMWSKSEEVKLRRLWKDKHNTIHAISETLGRTPNAIAIRLSRLGVVVNKEQAWEINNARVLSKSLERTEIANCSLINKVVLLLTRLRSQHQQKGNM